MISNEKKKMYPEWAEEGEAHEASVMVARSAADYLS